MGCIQSVADLEASTWLVLDLVGGFDRTVKMEEDEVKLLLLQHVSTYTCMLTASYTMHSVQARYNFILALVMLLFFFAEDLEDWDPSLLSKIFAVLRGIAMLPSSPHLTQLLSPPWTTWMRLCMPPYPCHISQHSSRICTDTCLVPVLLKQISGTAVDVPLAVTAHAFLNMSGLWQATSMPHAARLEVLWCKCLRSLKFLDVARETLEWLLRTPAVMYVWARLWLDIRRDAEVAEALDNLAGSFGMLSLFIALSLTLNNVYLTGLYSTLSFEDADALAVVLPEGQMNVVVHERCRLEQQGSMKVKPKHHHLTPTDDWRQ